MIFEEYKKPINDKGTHPATHSWQLHLISDRSKGRRGKGTRPVIPATFCPFLVLVNTATNHVLRRVITYTTVNVRKPIIEEML